MGSDLTGVYVYIAFLVLALGLVIAYYELVRLEWNEAERRRLEAAELELAQILQLLETPDVKTLMANHSDRQHLFIEYSESLKRDVLSVLRLRDFRPKALCLVGVFLLSYYLIRLKSYLFCGRYDLRFLSGLELALVRTLK